MERFLKYYRGKQELKLLEIVYFSLAGLTLLAAGIIALVNQSLGVSLLWLPGLFFGAGCTNILAWALIKLVADALDAKEELTKKSTKEAEPKELTEDTKGEPKKKSEKK